MTLRPSRGEVPRSTGRVGEGARGVGLGLVWWGGISGGGECWGRAATSWGEREAGRRGRLMKGKCMHGTHTFYTFRVRSSKGEHFGTQIHTNTAEVHQEQFVEAVYVLEILTKHCFLPLNYSLL